MDLHYSAFISYRHHPRDSKVAKEIQRRLEHFRVPGALKKQGQKIDRLFRDKDELSVTGSLTDTITAALEHSDYLIVICSPQTKESPWVQREIEAFLKTHTADRILTVLADGEEPYDVIPEILTGRDTVDPVTGRTVRESVEPLSCDWRLPRKRAVKEELPRLAAALMGCTYDELRQRQRQYKMRRLITAFSLGLCASLLLAGYFLYSGLQIRKNLDAALRNQSRYLAAASAENLMAGDRLTAIALALEALPDGQSDRPYVADAEQALADALALYDMEEQVISVAVFDARAAVSDFAVTDDARTLYILDDRGIMTAWDTDTFEKLAAFRVGSTKHPLMTGKNGCVMLLCDDPAQPLRCYDRSGTLLWQLENCRDAALCEGKETLLILRSEEAQTAAGVNRHYLLRVDPENGQLMEAPVSLFDSGTGDFPQLESDVYYDHRPLCVSAVTNGKRLQYAVDWRTGTVYPLPADGEWVYCISMAENGRIFMLLSDGTGAMNGRWQDMNVYSPAGAVLYCFDSGSGELLWDTPLETWMYSGHFTVAEIPGTGRIVCQYGNTYCQLDGDTGAIIARCVASAAPLATEVEATYLWSLYPDGSAGNYYFDSNEIMSIEYLDKTLQAGCVNRGLYTLARLDTRIVLYRSVADESYELFGGTCDGYAAKTARCGDFMVTEGLDSVNLFDVAARELLWSCALGDMGGLVGFTPDGSRIVCCNDRGQLSELDAATGEVCRRIQPLADQPAYSVKAETVRLTQTGFVFLADDPAAEAMQLVFCEPETEALEMYSCPVGGARFTVEYAGERYVLLFAAGHGLYQFDRYTAQFRPLPEGMTARPCVLMDEERDLLTVAAGHEIRVLDAGRKTVQTVFLPDVSAVSLCRRGEELLALCDDGRLYRFHEDGRQLSVTELMLYESFGTKISDPDVDRSGIIWNFAPSGELILNVFRMGNVIHPEQWVRIGTVEHLLTCHPETDSFICCADDRFYAFRRRGLEDMIQKAGEILADFELAEEQKAHYGLE